MPVRIRVLGPIEVVSGRRSQPIPGRNARAVLAALVLGISHAVSVDHLMIAVWGDRPPPSSRNTLQTHVSTLRTLLGRRRIRYEEDAYVLDIDPHDIDAVQFESLSLAAAEAVSVDAGSARRIAMDALELWRGRPFGDLADDEFVSVEVRRLEEIRMEVMEVRLEADLALGRHGPAAAILAGLVEDHPYRERLWYLFLTALACDGRRVEALRTYHRFEESLASIGLEPSRDLKDLEQQILVEAPDLRARLSHRDTSMPAPPDLREGTGTRQAIDQP